MVKLPVKVERFWRLLRGVSGALVEAFRFQNPIINMLLVVLFFPFILEMTYFLYMIANQLAEDAHLKRISHRLIYKTVKKIDVVGSEKVPASGPILFVGNHVGIGDALSVYVSAPRTDIHTMLFNNGIMQRFDEFHPYAIIIDKQNPTGALRQAVRQLKLGRSVLVFPRGEIEEDPVLYKDSALKSLDQWSTSIEFFVKHVPDLVVVPFAIGGIISRKALSNPIVKLYKVRNHQFFLAATFQLIFPMYRDAVARTYYGQPLTGKDAKLENIQAQMTCLLKKIHQELNPMD